MDEQKSGFFGLGSLFLLYNSFVSNNHEDESNESIENAERNAENIENYKGDDQPCSYNYFIPKEEFEKVKVETIEVVKSGSIPRWY